MKYIFKRIDLATGKHDYKSRPYEASSLEDAFRVGWCRMSGNIVGLEPDMTGLVSDETSIHGSSAYWKFIATSTGQ